jgi:decaprenyl-phosphate phosphoribosyltransferase
MIKHYLSIARFDHAIKHVFMIPGILLSIILNNHTSIILSKLSLGFFSAIMIASANYTINEYLDGPFDKYHPKKKMRPAAKGLIKKPLMIIQYAFFIILGLMTALSIGKIFFISSIIFLIAGLLYNVKPFRIKDVLYFDVILESFNNPIRLMLGWSIISENTIAPLSLIITYWFGGAFLMTSKRLAELRYMKEIDMLENLIEYRPNFKKYSENALIIALFVYAIFSSFNAGVFLIKYRYEYILLYPLIVLLFTYYLFLTLQSNSIVQAPEKLFKDTRLMMILVLLIVSFFGLTALDINFINSIFALKIPQFNIQ